MSVRVETLDDNTASNKNFEFRFIKSLEDPANGEVKGSSHNTCLEVSNQFGVSFILHNGNLRIIETNKLVTLDTLPPILKSGIDIVALSCDENLIATSQGSIVNIYDTKVFCQQLGNVNPNASFIVSKSGAANIQLAWNPADTRLIGALGKDGTLLNVRILDNWAIDAASAADTTFRCMSWSPKGKQLAVAGTNGIVQLKLDLKEAKRIPLPSVDLEPVSILWMSTLQFLLTFKPKTHEDISVMLLTLSKTGETVYKDMGDIFLSEEYADPKVTYKLIPQWKLYFLFSSTTQEVVTASSDPAHSSDFIIQLIEDKFRAALPLDNYIQGAGIFFGYNEPLMVNNEPTQPWPILLLLAQTGLVSIFHLVNNGAETINISVPQPITIKEGAVSTPIQQQPIAPQQITQQPPQLQQQQQPVFNLNKNLFGQPQQQTTPSAISTATSVPSSNLFGTTSFNFSKPATTQPLNFFGSLGTSTSTPTPTSSIPLTTTTASQQPTSIFNISTTTSTAQTFAPDPRLQKQQQQQAPISQQQQQQQPSLFSSTQSSIFGTPSVQKPAAPTTTTIESGLKSSFDFAPKPLQQQQTPALQPQQQLGSFGGAGDSLPSLGTLLSKDTSTQIKPTIGSGGGLPTTQEIQDVKSHLKKYDFKILLAQLNKFEQRLTNFKKAQAVQIATESELVKSYFNELDTKIRKDLNSMTDFSHNIVETTAGQREEIDGLCSMLQSLFNKIEYGLVAAEKRMDPKYLKLLRSQPIDPTSLNKLNQILKEFTYVSNQVRECRRYFYYEEQNLRPLDRKATEECIYKTLQHHATIIKYISKIVADLKMEVGGCRKSIMDESLNGSTLESDVTLDDLASGIKLLKLRKDKTTTSTSSPNLMAQFKKTTTFNRDKVASVRRWASQQTVTRVPISGAIDPFTEIKPRRIRLGIDFDEEEEEKNEQLKSRYIVGDKKTTEMVDSTSSMMNNNRQVITATSESNITIGAPKPQIQGQTAKALPSQQQQQPFFGVPSTTNNILDKRSIVTSTASITTPQVSFFGIPICSPQQSTTTKSTLGDTTTKSSFFATPAIPPISSKSSTTTVPPPTSSGVTITPIFKGADATTKTTTSSSGTPLSTSAGISFGTSNFGSSPILAEAAARSLTITPVRPTSTTTSTSLFAPSSTATTSSTTDTSKTAGFDSIFGGLSVTPISTSTTTTTPSIFGLSTSKPISTATPSTTTSSLFGSLSFSTPSTSIGITSTPSSTTTTAITAPPTTTSTSSLFGFSAPPTSTVATTTTSSLFGSLSLNNKAVITTSAPTTTGLFATPSSTPPSIFGTPAAIPTTTTTSIPVVPSTDKEKEAVTTIPATTPSVTTTTSQSLFGTPASTPSIFGSQTSSSFGTSSLFGALTTTSTPSTTTTATTQAPATTTSSTSLFGLPTVSPSISSSLFGSPQTQPEQQKPAETPSSLFGSLSVSPTPATTTSITPSSSTTTSSLFGAPTTIAATTIAAATSSIFGTPTTTTPVVQPSGSIFGATSPASTTSIFGQPAAVTTTTTTSVFGSPSTSIFGGVGGAVSPTQPPSGLFGSAVASSGGSVFGSPSFGQPVASSPTSPFGGGGVAQSTNVFGGSPFGGNATATSGGSILKPPSGLFSQGQQQQSTSVFGSPQATVTPTTTTAFGAAPAFGSSPVFGGSPAFGSSLKPSAFGGSIFGGGSSTVTTSSFGALASNAQAAPAFGSAAFGSTSPQQQTQQQQQTTAFGGASTFGGGGAAFGAPAFGGGSAFGQTQPQTGSVFGGSPTAPATSTSTFGLSQAKLGAPAFGGGAVFGGSPAFGTQTQQSSFGSGGSIFGGGGAATASNTGVSSFGNLATQATSQAPAFGSQPQAFGSQSSSGFGSFGSFGGAAQQQPPQQQQQQFGQQSSFGSFGQQAQPAQQKPASFGGNSFSSWR